MALTAPRPTGPPTDHTMTLWAEVDGVRGSEWKSEWGNADGREVPPR